MTDVFVDARYDGHHGIARYSSEVLARLTVEATHLRPGVRPASARDAVSPWRLSLPRDSLLYSPGFSTGPSTCRQLLTLHDLLHLELPGLGGTVRRAFYERVAKPQIRRTGAVLTVSRTSADLLQEWLGGSVRVHVTRNGVSEAFRRTDVGGAGGAPSSGDSGFVLLVSNFKPHKNVPMGLDALALLPDLPVVVVTPDVAQAERALAERGLAGRSSVRTGLSDPELAALYRRAGCLLFPSLTEGFGLPALEALHCGCPVVFLDECRSVAEICGGSQLSSSVADGPAGIAAQVARAVDGPFREPASLSTYSWSAVAAEVDRAVVSLCD